MPDPDDLFHEAKKRRETPDPARPGTREETRDPSTRDARRAKAEEDARQGRIWEAEEREPGDDRRPSTVAGGSR